MKLYMLDTNAVSHLLRGEPGISNKIQSVPMNSLSISSITEAELLFGLARRPQAKRLHRAVREFLKRVDTLPWDSGSADYYGATRAELESKGKTLAPLDLLIAAHALATSAILVTNDRAFHQVPDLRLEDWTL